MYQTSFPLLSFFMSYGVDLTALHLSTSRPRDQPSSWQPLCRPNTSHSGSQHYPSHVPEPLVQHSQHSRPQVPQPSNQHSRPDHGQSSSHLGARPRFNTTSQDL